MLHKVQTWMGTDVRNWAQEKCSKQKQSECWKLLCHFPDNFNIYHADHSWQKNNPELSSGSQPWVYFWKAGDVSKKEAGLIVYLHFPYKWSEYFCYVWADKFVNEPSHFKLKSELSRFLCGSCTSSSLINTLISVSLDVIVPALWPAVSEEFREVQT